MRSSWTNSRLGNWLDIAGRRIGLGDWRPRKIWTTSVVRNGGDCRNLGRGLAWPGLVGRGWVWPGEAGKLMARLGLAWRGKAGTSGLGLVRHGTARPGVEGRGMAGQGYHGMAWFGWARHGEVG